MGKQHYGDANAGSPHFALCISPYLDQENDYADLEFGVSFRGYANQRKDLLKVLRTLSHHDWLRGASVKVAKKRREETVLSYAERMARHEAGHCEQVERVLDARSRKGKPS